MYNSSFLTADRTTHLKIVIVSLLASITVMVVGIAARPQATDGSAQATVYKPPKAIMATSDPPNRCVEGSNPPVPQTEKFRQSIQYIRRSSPGERGIFCGGREPVAALRRPIGETWLITT